MALSSCVSSWRCLLDADFLFKVAVRFLPQKSVIYSNNLIHNNSAIYRVPTCHLFIHIKHLYICSVFLYNAHTNSTACSYSCSIKYFLPTYAPLLLLNYMLRWINSIKCSLFYNTELSWTCDKLPDNYKKSCRKSFVLQTILLCIKKLPFLVKALKSVTATRLASSGINSLNPHAVLD